MPRVTPEEAAAQWAQRLAQSGDRIRAGVQSVTVAPGQAAARQKALYLANIQAKADKWASRVASVSAQEWQQATIEKGLPRVAQGAQAAQGKMAGFMQQLLPHIDQTVRSLPPRGDIEANINRMAQFARGMAKFQRR
ncbi:MAG TPA: hypothetical protein VNJ28_04685 [Candidatus Limnocylindrales bacterium]|nr:hypothetical protein [Candidatus Limnocylindrales bacterium]